jgi:hypothetical protein
VAKGKEAMALFNPNVPFGQCENVQAAMHQEHHNVEEALAKKPAYEETGQ